MANLDFQVRRLRRLHFAAGLNMLFFWFLMAIAYGAAKQFRVFQLPTFITGSNFGPNASPLPLAVGTVNTSVLVANFVLLTWIFHHIEAIWAERVLLWIRTGAQWLRWVEYSFSASLMLLAISLTSGVFDVGTLLVVFATYNACMIFGGISEWHLSARGAEGKKQALAFYVLSCVFFLAAWVPTFISFFVTLAYGTGSATTPTFVYVIIFALFALQFPFIIIFTVKMWHMWNMTTTASEFLDEHGYKYECWYIYMSFAAKSVLAWTVFGAAFQQGDVSAFPEPTNVYSEWVVAAFGIGAFMWLVSALTYQFDQGRNAFNVLGNSDAHPVFRRVFRILGPLSAAARLATVGLCAAYLLDFQDLGWLSGLALGIHLGCEALYIPAVDAILSADQPTAHRRRTAVVIRLASFASYAIFVIVAMVTLTETAPRIAVIILGAVVLLQMLVTDVVLQPRHVLDAAKSGGLRA